MNVKEIISKYLPVIIPEAGLFYEFIPEDADIPAIAYMTGNETMPTDLDGVVYQHIIDVSFAIISGDYNAIELINRRMLNLIGINKLPGVQLIELINKDDSSFPPELSDMMANEINFRFYMRS